MMFGFGFLFMVIVPILLIGGIVWLVSALWRGSPGTGITLGAQQQPLDVLKARYAKGEITKEQFEQMKQDLA